MPNVADLLSARLSSTHLQVLRRSSEVAAERGVPVYLVGGAVRDILLGIAPPNLDLVAVRPEADFAALLSKELGGEVKSSSEFGTYKLAVAGDAAAAGEIDLAMARRERYPSPGALPVVQPSSLEDDLGRRDFTVNAMAVSLNEEAWGELFDPFDGRRDLDAGVLRVLHDRSFVDDATRVLRGVRYAVRLGLHMEPETLRLLKRDQGYLDRISPDRVRHELDRVLEEPAAPRILQAADEYGALAAIHPALRFGPATGVETAAWEPDGELPRSDVVLAALLYCSDSAGVDRLAARLNMDSSWMRAARDVAALKSADDRLRAPRLRRSELFALLSDAQPASIRGCFLATEDPQVRERLDLYLTELRHVRPILDGHDLMALGVPEGPVVGRLLDKLLAARLEGLLSTREDEEAMVARSVKGPVGES